MENIGGCSLLLVIARKLGSWSLPQVVAWESRGLESPSSCNWKTKEFGSSNECNSSRHIRKNIMCFSPTLGFHIKTLVYCVCVWFFICSLLIYSYWMIMIHWYFTWIIWFKRIKFLYYWFTPPLLVIQQLVLEQVPSGNHLTTRRRSWIILRMEHQCLMVRMVLSMRCGA